MNRDEMFATIAAFRVRQAEAKKNERIDSSRLYAGSPMYFYCRLCGIFLTTLPETYVCSPPGHCGPCQKMLDAGWQKGRYRFVETTSSACLACRGNGRGGKDYYTGFRRRCARCFGSGHIKGFAPFKAYDVIIRRSAKSLIEAEALIADVQNDWEPIRYCPKFAEVSRSFDDERKAMANAKIATDCGWLALVFGREDAPALV